MNTSILERLSRCRSLPSPPGIAMQLLDLYEDENATLERAGALIGRDPALAAKVLKVANSQAYGARREVTRLNHALALLGMRAVLAVALSFTLSRGKRGSDGRGFNHDRYWRRAVTSALAARTLAEVVIPSLKEEIALAALLQDIGMLALAEALPEDYQEIAAKAQGDHTEVIQVEREKLGLDHAEVSAFLLEKWRLPEIYGKLVGQSHGAASQESLEPKLATAVKVVRASGKLAAIWAQPDTEAASQQAWLFASELLGIDQATFGTVLEQIERGLPELTELFQVDVGDSALIHAISEQARDALTTLSILATQQAEVAEKRYEVLSDEAKRDGLTRLYNRAALDRMIDQELARAKATGRPLSVLFCDVDHFKKVNDTHGHQAGDMVLIAVAQVLSGNLRATDFVGRYGGEEFVVVLPATTEQNAKIVGERLRAALANAPIALPDGRPIKITASFGLATFTQPMEVPKDLLDAADKAVYAAKSAGRNRVITFVPGLKS